MKGLVCLGDKNTHGGYIISTSSTMYLNGKQVALVGDVISCQIHGVNTIIEDSTTTLIMKSLLLLRDGIVFKNGLNNVYGKQYLMITKNINYLLFTQPWKWRCINLNKH